MSTIESEAENLGLGLASQNELKQFYEKGSKIDGFVSYPNKFESGAKIKAEEALTKKVSGTEPTTKIPIFDNGAKFVQVGVNPTEALWLDMMGYAVEDIARIFGAPPHKIGALRQSTNNNIEQQSMDYVNDCLLPHAKEMEEELERKLLNSDEKINHFFKFNFNGLLRGDSQARASLYNSLFQNGGITPNQICKLEDLPTFEGGDEHYVQLNMISVTNAASYYQTLQTDKTAKRMEIEDILEIIEKRNLTKV
jgi:HK97 family phage portal protein